VLSQNKQTNKKKITEDTMETASHFNLKIENKSLDKIFLLVIK